MDAIIFSWSGSFREEFEKREDEIHDFIERVQARDGEIGIVTDEGIEEVEDLLPTDFEIPHVDDLQEVLASLNTKYDKVFFVSDVEAELVNANRSGAFTVGLASVGKDVDELSGVGPNYVVESLDELAEILRLERL